MRNICYFFSILLITCSAYCQADPSPIITSGDLAFVTAQFPIDATGRMASGTIQDLTTLAINNMKAVLKTKGIKLNQVIKTTICLSDMRDLAAMNYAYTLQFNTATPPTQEVIESVNMPYGSRIQISCIADKSRK